MPSPLGVRGVRLRAGAGCAFALRVPQRGPHLGSLRKLAVSRRTEPARALQRPGMLRWAFSTRRSHRRHARSRGQGRCREPQRRGTEERRRSRCLGPRARKRFTLAEVPSRGSGFAGGEGAEFSGGGEGAGLLVGEGFDDLLGDAAAA